MSQMRRAISVVEVKGNPTQFGFKVIKFRCITLYFAPHYTPAEIFHKTVAAHVDCSVAERSYYTVYFTSQRNFTANGDRPAKEGKLKAAIEWYLNAQHAALHPWGLLESGRARRQMTLKVSIDSSTSSSVKSLYPDSLMTPHGGPIISPIWLLSMVEMHVVLIQIHCMIYLDNLYSAYGDINLFVKHSCNFFLFLISFLVMCCFTDLKSIACVHVSNIINVTSEQIFNMDG